ncbi:GAF domain-containing SpoIIE family protein phosphatase [Calditrichota bacterium]
MNNIISDDIIQILDYHKNLFQYQNLLLFSSIGSSDIKPLVSLNPQFDAVFPVANQLVRLNDCRDTLKKTDIDKDAHILNFFEQFQLDVLFPIREEITCFGFLGISNQGVLPDPKELSINKMVVRFLANIWKNQQILLSALSSSKQIDPLLNKVDALLDTNNNQDICNDLQTIIQNIVVKSMKVMNVQAASLMLVSEDQQELEFKVAFFSHGGELKPLYKPINKSIAEWVAEHGEPVIIEDACFYNPFDTEIDNKADAKTNSLLCVPLNYKNKFIGIIQVLNKKDKSPFQDDDLQLLSNFSLQAAAAIENSRRSNSLFDKEDIDNIIIQTMEYPNWINSDNINGIDGLSILCSYHPLKNVVSNIYGAFQISKYEMIFILADVLNQNPQETSLLSTLVNRTKNLINNTDDIQLIVNKLNSLLIEKSTNSKFLSFFISHYNQFTLNFSYINAGHKPPFWLQRGSSSRILPSCGPIIGMVPYHYYIQNIKVKKDDLILMYSDGLTEILDSRNKAFGDDKLRLVVDLHNEFDYKLLHDTILQYIDIHTKDITKSKDYGILVLQIK